MIDLRIVSNRGLGIARDLEVAVREPHATDMDYPIFSKIGIKGKRLAIAAIGAQLGLGLSGNSTLHPHCRNRIVFDINCTANCFSAEEHARGPLVNLYFA